MLLLVGLGNPTPNSHNNRHNIGFRKTTAQLNEYSYDLKIFEERYNIMTIWGWIAQTYE